jgi:hypothetical protein
MTATTTTLRLPAPLKAEADAYAASLGLSLNALCAVALRDYLDARAKGGRAPKRAERPLPEPRPAPRGGLHAACWRCLCALLLRERSEVEVVPRETGRLTK